MPHPASARPPQPGDPAGDRRLPALAAVAALSALPPFVGPALGLELDVPRGVEVVDHLVPGLVALLACAYAVVLSRRGLGETTAFLAALGVCVLAGMWQVATHAGLVLDAGAPGRPPLTVLWHAAPGVALLGTAVWVLLAPPRGAGR